MKRGSIVSVVGKGDFSTKPRPALIVQSDVFEGHPSFLVCPITGELTGATTHRIAISPDDINGLEKPSEIEVDKVQSIWGTRIGGTFGTISPLLMRNVEVALRRWLDL